jgi:uncharacterized membrane protein
MRREIMPKSSTGLDENVAGLLCYVGGWITGLIFLVLEKDSKFVKFHALQSLVVFGAISAVLIVLQFFTFIPFLGIVISAVMGLLGLLAFILWIILMLKAYQHELFKLPWSGDFAEKQVK